MLIITNNLCCLPDSGSDTLPTMPLDSIEKRLYQLIINRLDGDKIGIPGYEEKIIGLVRKGIGGFILFGGRRDEIKDFLDHLESSSEVGLFIASDTERGVGQQVRGTTIFPCQMAIAAALDKQRSDHVSLLEDAIRAFALEAKDTGINMPLIPVLDVNRNPDNPIICTRAFSDNPEDVSWFGSEYIRILEEEGLISCAKHFPGHGDTATDSHISLPVITKSYRSLKEMDILPFVTAIKSRVGSIMVGHLSIPGIDPLPASLSPRVIHLLRNELGFDGIIITDALTMDALRGMENVPLRCLHAGIDMLLHPEDADMMVKGLLTDVRAGRLQESQVDTAVSRILTVKRRLADMRRDNPDYPYHTELSVKLTGMSITLVKQSPGILPIPDVTLCKVAFAGDERLYDSSPLKDVFTLHPFSRQHFFAGMPGGTREKPHEILIIAIFTSVSAWKGSSGIEGREEERLLELMRKAGKSVVISFGSPYVLRRFADADVLIAAYDATHAAQIAVMDCLTGKRDFMGRLPVRIRFADG